MPLRLRLALLVALAVSCLTLLGALYLYASLGSSIRATLDRALIQRSDRVVFQVSSNALPLATQGKLIPSKDQAIVQIMAMSGRVLYASALAGSRPLVKVGSLEKATNQRMYVTEQPVKPGGNSTLLYLRYAVSSSGKVVVVVGTSLDELTDSERHMFHVLIFGVPIIVLVAAVGAWFLAGKALLPVEVLRNEAEALSRSHTRARLEVPKTRDELAALARTFNDFLSSLEVMVANQRHFVAAASHELRSPLASLSAELELAQRSGRNIDELRQTVHRASRKVEDLIKITKDLLMLAAGDEGMLSLNLETVSLEQLVVNVLEQFRQRADELEISFALDVDPILYANLDAKKFEHVLSNVIENSLGFAPVTSIILMRGRLVAGFAEISVLDEGPGFPIEFIPRAFERFTRAHERKGRTDGGAGLGLSIAKLIVDKHHGTISVSNSSNGGAITQIRIPLTQTDVLSG